MVKKIRTKSDTGESLIVEINDDSVRAFRVDKPEITVTGKAKGKSERDLENALFRDPVMRIDKRDKNVFDVDFGAGFQRGSVMNQEKKDLTDEVNVEMYHGEDIKSDKGWLEWIGLDPDMPELDRFLDRGRGHKKVKKVV